MPARCNGARSPRRARPHRIPALPAPRFARGEVLRGGSVYRSSLGQRQIVEENLCYDLAGLTDQIGPGR